MSNPSHRIRRCLFEQQIRAVPFETMLANTAYGTERADVMKGRVYDRILEYLNIEGYPQDANPDFNEANVCDLLYSIISSNSHLHGVGDWVYATFNKREGGYIDRL